jgi:hypothetical protein
VRRTPSLSIGKIQQGELVQAPIKASAGSEVLVIIVCNRLGAGHRKPAARRGVTSQMLTAGSHVLGDSVPNLPALYNLALTFASRVSDAFGSRYLLRIVVIAGSEATINDTFCIVPAEAVVA